MGTPLLLSTDVRKEDSQVFVDFLVFDVAMFEVGQMGFEAAGESAPGGALIDKKEGIIGDNKIYKLDLSDYRFALPRQIIVNAVLTRQLAPTLSNDYIISHLNLIVTP
uniref:Uncharacterized protein n=1 Tax=Plectus sambesii TaxID=2011161 RepID=A0A914VQL1_9BILA